MDTLEQDTGKRDKEQEIKKDKLSPLTLDLPQNPEYGIKYEKIRSLLESINLNDITPLQALQILDKIKDEIK